MAARPTLKILEISYFFFGISHELLQIYISILFTSICVHFFRTMVIFFFSVLHVTISVIIMHLLKFEILIRYLAYIQCSCSARNNALVHLNNGEALKFWT